MKGFAAALLLIGLLLQNGGWPLSFRKDANCSTSVLCNLHAQRKWSGYPKSSKHSLIKATITLLLAVSGDIHPNPGPSIYPCGLCDRPVTWSQDGICCDQCSIWIHRSCVEMCSADYRALCHSNVQWICCKCETINISTFTFRSYELSSQNYYEPLSEDISQNSWKSTDQFSPLLTSSPKTLPPQQSKNQLSKHSLSTDNRQENEHRKQNSVEDRTSAAFSDVPELKTKENLRILNINCQSITDKKAEFAATLEYIKPDIVCGTESWLHGIQPEKTPATNATGSSEVFPPGYTPYRNDRSTLRGGVFVLVKEDLPVQGLRKRKKSTVTLKYHGPG